MDTAPIHEILDRLIEEAEAELGRPLTDDEHDSLVDEFLAGLEDAQ